MALTNGEKYTKLVKNIPYLTFHLAEKIDPPCFTDRHLTGGNFEIVRPLPSEAQWMMPGERSQYPRGQAAIRQPEAGEFLGKILRKLVIWYYWPFIIYFLLAF